jgi:hypothetical protein
MTDSIYHDDITMDTEFTNQDDYDRTIDMIDNLYSVIVKFQTGESITSHPYAMRFMTKTDFVNWIIYNNKRVSDILRPK